MNWTRWAKSAPATPAKKADITNTSIFVCLVFTLTRFEATSSSRIESMARP